MNIVIVIVIFIRPYRAMHYSAKRGLAIAWRPSVRLSDNTVSSCLTLNILNTKTVLLIVVCLISDDH